MESSYIQVGMRNFHIRKNQHHMPAINLDKLWTLVSTQTKEKYKNHPEKKVPVIDVVRAVMTLFLCPIFLHNSAAL